MSTTVNFKKCVLESLSIFDDVLCRPMMGEYLIYINGILVGGIYDNRFLIKNVKTNEKYHLPQEIPYEKAKPMAYINNLWDKATLKEILEDTMIGLKK